MSIAVDAIGYASAGLSVVGSFLLARRSHMGWWARIGSVLLWAAYGLGVASIPNVVNAVVFLGINIYGLRKWQAERGRR